MLSVHELPDGILEIVHDGIFTVDDWHNYQATMLKLLDDSDSTLYIMTNFSQTVSFAREIVPEAGTARHLTHPNLGFLILLGGNALQNFILQLTDARASRDQRNTKMRVLQDRDRALETLRNIRESGASLSASI